MRRREALIRIKEKLIKERQKIIGDNNKYPVAQEIMRGDSGDESVDGESKELNGALSELESKRLKEIDDALLRFRQKTYGVCQGQDCGKDIATQRLLVLPTAVRCFNCQRESEKYGGRMMDIID